MQETDQYQFFCVSTDAECKKSLIYVDEVQCIHTVLVDFFSTFSETYDEINNLSTLYL